MASPIKYHKLFGLKYQTYGEEICCGTKPQNALVDDDSTFFDTANRPNQWCQISFSKIFSVESYIIRAPPTLTHRPKSWIINASLDNISWRTVDSVSLSGDVGGNKTPFTLSEVVSCMHFRIVLLTNSTPDRYELKYSFFDCFCKIPFKQCFTKQSNYIGYKLFIDVLITSLSISYS